MTNLLIDSSVVLKWFHSKGELELTEARALRDAHVAGHITAHILDLAIYEIGNVLIRALHWTATDAADQLDDLMHIVGPPIIPDPLWHRDATELAVQHRLSFYDASWAGAAKAIGVPLVSADKSLLRAGLAESPTVAAARL